MQQVLSAQPRVCLPRHTLAQLATETATNLPTMQTTTGTNPTPVAAGSECYYLVIAWHIDKCASWNVNIIHLNVRHSGAQTDIPVDQAVVTVDAPRLIHAHKGLQHSNLLATYAAKGAEQSINPGCAVNRQCGWCPCTLQRLCRLTACLQAMFTLANC
eukprot:GHRR01030702.1.p1 GENE.GHRR01030702.1~~GHRR01030702.1.p1  ORF type:complete len:158 (+),score=25.42 GHRR01030702.1:163-636(+)